LKTKADETGKIVIQANQWFASSKICNVCGNKNKSLGNETEWQCPVCGEIHHRDVNAAKNLRDYGILALQELQEERFRLTEPSCEWQSSLAVA
jgi:putative transposase